MLAKLKKQSSSHKNGGAPWRVDFRDSTLLPDTKTVRTRFLINILVFTILGSLILTTAHREITLFSIKEEIDSLQRQISSASAPNATAEAAFKLFQGEEKKLKEIYSWATSSFDFADYLIHLGELMPAGVKASRIEYKGAGSTILVMGSVDGQDAKASATASKFFETLANDSKFKESFISVTNSNLGRNASADTLNFELIFTFIKPAVKK